MSQRKRLERLEGELSPKELVLLWMGEAHAYGDVVSYTRWLLTQPDGAYPLVKMPRHLYEASRARAKGREDEEFRASLRSRYRDLLFLFHLHSQLTERAAHKEKELIWRSLLLGEQQRRLLDQEEAEAERLALLKLLPKKPRAPRRTGKESRFESLPMWSEQLTTLREEVVGFLGAAGLISRRYFSGEDVLYPETRNLHLNLLEALHHLSRLHDLCFGTQAERDRVLDLDEEEPPPLGAPSAAAHALARELVVLAKEEAMTMLGEQDAGNRLVEEWLRATIGEAAMGRAL